MIKPNFKILIILLLSIIYIGCDDILEEDISDDNITLVSPENQSKIEGNFVQFQWDPLNGANDYRVQVSNASQQLIKDTLVNTNHYSTPLTPGEYNWRVRGENFAYKTGYSLARNFTISSVDDLRGQMVFLTFPSDNIYMKSSGLTLQWQSISVAESYTIEVKKLVSGNETLEVSEDDITNTTYKLDASSLDADGKYTWRVLAKNKISNTDFTSRIIFIDNEVPTTATLNSPKKDIISSISNPIDFVWVLPQDVGEVQSEITSILEIATDENFTSIIKTYTTKLSSQSHTFSTVGDYYWRVRLIDLAGNVGQNSDNRKLTIE